MTWQTSNIFQFTFAMLIFMYQLHIYVYQKIQYKQNHSLVNDTIYLFVSIFLYIFTKYFTLCPQTTIFAEVRQKWNYVFQPYNVLHKRLGRARFFPRLMVYSLVNGYTHFPNLATYLYVSDSDKINQYPTGWKLYTEPTRWQYTQQLMLAI